VISSGYLGPIADSLLGFHRSALSEYQLVLSKLGTRNSSLEKSFTSFY
jgi:hypothetical protein